MKDTRLKRMPNMRNLKQNKNHTHKKPLIYIMVSFKNIKNREDINDA